MPENSRLEGALSLDELLEQVTISRVEDIRTAAENLNRIATVRGMRVALHDDIASQKPMTDANGNSLNGQVFKWATSGQWWDHPRFGSFSPIMRACLCTNEPFWCNAQGIYGYQKNKNLDRIDATACFSAEECNMRTLIIVPVHLPFGQVSANVFPLVDATLDNLTENFEQYGLLLGTLTRRFISNYVSVKSNSDRISPECTLSNREVECLILVAVGKTDTEIGATLLLCRSTIRFHIRNAAAKLGTGNRTQTAVIAAQLGYLGANGGYTISDG
ncbi:hypothetical protein A8B75_06980 [Sphingomonadales bacterium EhC05]|nr:hypothetical protein A8B75_06980 [Sphingomonadales bacterium EhC05]